MKRILSLILCLLIVVSVFSVLPTSVSAAEWGSLSFDVFATSPEDGLNGGKVTDVTFTFSDKKMGDITRHTWYSYKWLNEKNEVIAEDKPISYWFPYEFAGKRFTLAVTIDAEACQFKLDGDDWLYRINLRDVRHHGKYETCIHTDHMGRSIRRFINWTYDHIHREVHIYYTFDYAKFPVAKQSLTVAEPKIGESPDVTGEAGCDDFVIDSVTWMDDTDLVILTPYSEFKEDHTYTAVATIINRGNYYFPYGMKTFGFNGYNEEVIVKTSYDNGYIAKCQVYHTFPPLTPDPTTVNGLEISLTEPAPGAKPDYNAVVPEGKGYALDSEGGVMWFNVTDDDTYIDPDSDYVFEPYKEYRAMISLVTTGDDYKFASKNRLAKLNGMEVGFSDYGWNEDKSVYVESYYVCAPEGGTAIRQVDIEMDEPSVGDMPYYYAMTDSDLYRLTDAEDDDERYISNGIGWYDENDLRDMAYTDRFEEGKTYKWSVRLTSNSCSFAPADEISATVNGREGHIKRLSDRTVLLWTYYAMPGSTLPVIEQKTDQATGVTVEAMSDTTLEVDAVDTGSMTVVVDGSVAAAYDISLKKNGSTVQPDGSVTVSIPCDDPDGKVYRVEADNSLTDMNAVYMGGCLVFTTDHFSLYVVAASEGYEPGSDRLLGDADDNGAVNVFDASYIQKGLTGTSGYPEYSKMDKSSVDYLAADTDGDGTVNIFDAALIQKYLSGSSSAQSYGIGQKMK